MKMEPSPKQWWESKPSLGKKSKSNIGKVVFLGILLKGGITYLEKLVKKLGFHVLNFT